MTSYQIPTVTKPDKNFLNFYMYSRSLGDLIKNVDPVSVALEWGSKFCISNKLPNDEDVAHL